MEQARKAVGHAGIGVELRRGRKAQTSQPLTVAVLGLDGKAPRLQSLAVPVYGAADLPVGQRLSGQFEVPVPLGTTLPPGDCVAFVLMDGVPYGPQKFQLR